jgi:hypothetical protein
LAPLTATRLGFAAVRVEVERVGALGEAVERI